MISLFDLQSDFGKAFVNNLTQTSPETSSFSYGVNCRHAEIKILRYRSRQVFVSEEPNKNLK